MFPFPSPRILRCLALVAALLLPWAASSVAAAAVAEKALPIAEARPHLVKSPHGDRNDEYYWLRDDTRSRPDVLAYLQSENDYFEARRVAFRPLEDKLFGEIRGRVAQDDATVPYRDRGDWFATRFVAGQEFPVHVRHAGSIDAPEQVLLDVNAMAAGHEYYQVAGHEISDGRTLYAFAEDTQGRLQYVIRVRDLTTGELLPDRIPGTSGAIAWAADDRTLFYVANDPVTLRSRTVKRHRLGTDVASDVVVHDERDESYYTSVERSSSRRFVVITLSSTESDEQRVLPADQPQGRFVTLAPRQRGFHYLAHHLDRRWVILTDWQAPNYRVMQVDESRVGDRRRWLQLVPHDRAVFIGDLRVFDRYLVLDERAGALRRLRVQPWSGGRPMGATRVVQSDEAAYAAALERNPDPHTDVLRYSYTSLTTPQTIFDLDMKSGERTLRRRQPVAGGYDAALYVTERVWARARDGTQVPVSVVRRRSTPLDGSAPLLVHGYGAYGRSADPTFRPELLSLLDRGVVFAIAHVRGGQELGRAWYEDGRRLHKINSLTDFIDATEALLRQGYGARGKVFAEGRSAGGLLMGAVVNLRPDLFRGVIATVPFVDAVTTMLDESIPLTTNEFDEWGNPKERACYDYLLSYSPYDNVRPHAYPALLVQTGLHDSQVLYHEPAKWVARLRAAKHAAGDDATPLLFKVNMEAGHGGPAGRFQRLRETATEYAFVLDLLGVKE